MLCCAIAASCSFDRAAHTGRCTLDTDCAAKQECYRGFCVAGPDSDLEGLPCEPTETPPPCFDGDATTLDVGACMAGTRRCVGGTYTACLNEVVARPEQC